MRQEFIIPALEEMLAIQETVVNDRRLLWFNSGRRYRHEISRPRNFDYKDQHPFDNVIRFILNWKNEAIEIHFKKMATLFSFRYNIFENNFFEKYDEIIVSKSLETGKVTFRVDNVEHYSSLTWEEILEEIYPLVEYCRSPAFFPYGEGKVDIMGDFDTDRYSFHSLARLFGIEDEKYWSLRGDFKDSIEFTKKLISSNF